MPSLRLLLIIGLSASTFSCKRPSAAPLAINLDLKFSPTQTYLEKILTLKFVRDYKLVLDSLTAPVGQESGAESEEFFIQPTLRLKHKADMDLSGDSGLVPYFDLPAKKLEIIGKFKVKSGQTLSGGELSGERSLVISKDEIANYVLSVVTDKNISPDDVMFALGIALHRVTPDAGEAGWLDSVDEDSYSAAALQTRIITLKSATLSFTAL
jgi:hypothetical protein